MTIPVRKVFLALSVNLVAMLVVFALSRWLIVTPNQAIIDVVVQIFGCTAHFWYARSLCWKLKIPVAFVSAFINNYFMWAYIIAVLHDAI
jgi:hypothetical protein